MLERDLRGRSEVDHPFYNQISNLVERSLTGRPGRARRAKKELIAGVTADPFFDTTFITFEALLRLIISEKNPTTMRESVSFLGELLGVAAASVTQMEAKELRVNPQTVRTADRMIVNDAMIQRNRYLQTLVQRVIPKGYQNMLRTAEYVKSSTQGSMEIRMLPSSLSDEDRIKCEQESRLLVDWQNSLVRFQMEGSPGFDKDMALTGKRDDLVDILKAEPTVKIAPRQRLITRAIAGLSIEGIERMSYPTTDQQLDRITDYLTNAFSLPMSSRDRDIIESLFFGSTFFRMEPYGAVHYRNFNLLANINLWQERFIQRLIQDQDPQREKQVKIILQGISEHSAGWLLYNALQFVSYPLEHDPEFRGDNFEERCTQHPFFYQAIAEYRSVNPDDSFIYADEVGTHYFQTVLSSLLEQRLDYFGVSRKFADIMTAIKTEFKERPFSIIHLDTLDDYFESHCGQEFLGRLNNHFNDIRSITRSAWQSATERGLHYLPMQQGVNRIKFAEGSVPNILGIESVMLNTSGSLQEWEENVTFILPGTLLAIHGKLDQEGRLRLKAPLEDRIPGLYILLNHIAVLTFHDLVVQEKKETEEQVKRDEHRTASVGQQARADSPCGKSHGRVLPRIQTDAELISDVYKKTRQTPRRVELHKRRLHGNDDYLKSISLYEGSRRKYEATIRSHNREEDIENASRELAVAATELRAAREHAKKASDVKVRSLPARFHLGNVQDPITNEVRYFETWVVEHTSPKPTEEELKSPAKLFERYYSQSSALALLDQLKPWFVGE